jgi:hypothetical protein
MFIGKLLSAIPNGNSTSNIVNPPFSSILFIIIRPNKYPNIKIHQTAFTLTGCIDKYSNPAIRNHLCPFELKLLFSITTANFLKADAENIRCLINIALVYISYRM